jgi:hypothetical protein
MREETMTEEDAEIQVAAEVIADLLDLIEPEKRLAALAIAIKAEEAERKEREAHGGFRIFTFDETSTKEFLQSPGMRYWNHIMRFKARAICMFVRNITNNHSPKAAGQLLFRHQPNVPGSGYLEEYLDDLPRSNGRTLEVVR